MSENKDKKKLIERIGKEFCKVYNLELRLSFFDDLEQEKGMVWKRNSGKDYGFLFLFKMQP